MANNLVPPAWYRSVAMKRPGDRRVVLLGRCLYAVTAVTMLATFALLGEPPYTLADGVRLTIDWLRSVWWRPSEQ